MPPKSRDQRWPKITAHLEAGWVRWGFWSPLTRGALDDQRLGSLGEALAAHYLKSQGLHLAAQRRHIAGVEVDWIARSGGRWVLVEVKCSAVPREQRLDELRFPPGLRLDEQRWRRLCYAARALAERGQSARIDLVEVLLAGPRRMPELRWHRGCSGPWPRPSVHVQGALGRAQGFPRGRWFPQG
jgi:Holliday junction resolvase-like predicted endonuclease